MVTGVSVVGLADAWLEWLAAAAGAALDEGPLVAVAGLLHAETTRQSALTANTGCAARRNLAGPVAGFLIIT